MGLWSGDEVTLIGEVVRRSCGGMYGMMSCDTGESTTELLRDEISSTGEGMTTSCSRGRCGGPGMFEGNGCGLASTCSLLRRRKTNARRPRPHRNMMPTMEATTEMTMISVRLRTGWSRSVWVVAESEVPEPDEYRIRFLLDPEWDAVYAVEACGAPSGSASTGGPPTN